MNWPLINDLFAPIGKKKSFIGRAECPYGDCPSQAKPRYVNREEWEGNKPKPKLRFVQVISPLVHQYRCGYCSCIHNRSIEVPDDRGGLFGLNRKLYMTDRSARDLRYLERQIK